MKDPHLQKFDSLISKEWKRIFNQKMSSKVYKIIKEKDTRLYAMYMTQVYYYAYHTPRSLAMAGANLVNEDTKLMQHFFEHGLEENGHDIMAFNDIKALGVPLKTRKDMPAVLPSTEVMIAYVKFLSLSNEPYRSLGYHYWIEQPYKYIEQFMQTIIGELNLKKSQFRFYSNHKRIDQGHGNDIKSILSYYCKTEQQWEAVYQVALTTMRLFEQIIIEILNEYEMLKKDSSLNFQIINRLKPEKHILQS